MKLQFSWQQVAVVAIVAGVLVALALTHNLSALGAVGASLATVLGLVARSPLAHGDAPAPAASFPDEEPTKKEGRSIPPLQTILFLVGCALFGARVLTGCAAAAESTYTAQQLECVDKAKTLEESKACRADVRKRWGVVLDAGVDQ